MKRPAVYILANKPDGVLYVGVTSDVAKRGWQHRGDAVEGFNRRYRWHDPVYFEPYACMLGAIERKRGLKNWRRTWKVALIEGANPRWRDPWPALIG